MIVTVSDRRSNEITVLGEVSSPTRFPAETSGNPLMTVLARAGGTRNPAYESVITVQRRGRTEQALLTAAVIDPRQNINIVPGDVVYVSREPRSFLVFGATNELPLVSWARTIVASSSNRKISHWPTGSPKQAG